MAKVKSGPSCGFCGRPLSDKGKPCKNEEGKLFCDEICKRHYQRQDLSKNSPPPASRPK